MQRDQVATKDPSEATLPCRRRNRRKREARSTHKASAVAKHTVGLKAKMMNRAKRLEKIQMKKTLKARDERDVKAASTSETPDQALPTYLLDREGQKDAKALSSAVKERRKDKAAKYAVPLPQVRGIAEDEVFKVMKTGKRKGKGWKRMVTKATFVGESFTRKPPKLERFVRPMGLRYKKAHITHREFLEIRAACICRLVWYDGIKTIAATPR